MGEGEREKRDMVDFRRVPTVLVQEGSRATDPAQIDVLSALLLSFFFVFFHAYTDAVCKFPVAPQQHELPTALHIASRRPIFLYVIE